MQRSCQCCLLHVIPRFALAQTRLVIDAARSLASHIPHTHAIGYSACTCTRTHGMCTWACMHIPRHIHTLYIYTCIRIILCYSVITPGYYTVSIDVTITHCYLQCTLLLTIYSLIYESTYPTLDYSTTMYSPHTSHYSTCTCTLLTIHSIPVRVLRSVCPYECCHIGCTVFSGAAGTSMRCLVPINGDIWR